jgi:hypothetical protein
LPAAGGAQDPCVVTPEAFVNVPGRVSVTTMPVPAAKPKFCTWIVYVSVDATNTGVGDAVIESAISESPVISTRTDVDVTLLDATGSVVCEVTSAELTIVVPAAVPAFTVTTNVKFPLVTPLFTFAAAVQMTWPVAPTAGAVGQVHPAGGVIEANTVLIGVC